MKEYMYSHNRRPRLQICKEVVAISVLSLSLLFSGCNSFATEDLVSCTETRKVDFEKPNSPQNGLSFELSLPQSTFSKNEPVISELRIRYGVEYDIPKGNLINVHPQMDRDLLFYIYDPCGNAVLSQTNGYVNRDPYPLDFYFVFLYPANEFLTEVGDLRRIYDMNMYGEYQMQVVYKNDSDPTTGVEAWKGIIYSDIITFELVP